MAPARSMPECAASDNMPSDPVSRPATSLSTAMDAAAVTERAAADFFSAVAVRTGGCGVALLIAAFSVHATRVAPLGLAVQAVAPSAHLEQILRRCVLLKYVQGCRSLMVAST